MEKSIRYTLIDLICFFASGCSEEDSAGSSTGSNVIDIEVIDSSSGYGYIPRATHESVLVIEQDYGGTVYNEATDQEIYVETHYYETCIRWQHYLGAFTNICLAWAPATRAEYEIPLAVGENRIYMGFTRDVDTTTVEPSIIIERVSLIPIEVVHHENCDTPFLLNVPTLLIGNESDRYICFLFKADISKVYTVLTVSNGKLYFNIYDINSNLLAKGDTIEWSDEFQYFVEVQLDAGQQIYIQISSTRKFELGLY